MALRPVGVRSHQEHEDRRASGERAPGLRAVHLPAALDLAGRGRDRRDVAAEVGLGDRDGGQRLAGRQPRQPPLALGLGAAVHEGAGEDLGSRDQRAADAERAPGELLGGDDHAEVVARAPGGEPAVGLRDAQPEAAELGEPGDEALGDVPVVAVHVLGVGADLVCGEAVERVGDQGEVLVQVRVAWGLGERGEERGVARRSEELADRRHPARLDAEHRLPADGPRREVGERVGDERAREPGLGVAVRAVPHCTARHGGR